MYHFMVSESARSSIGIISWCQKYWTIWNFISKDNWCKDFNLDFTVSYHLDLKDLLSRGIVTYNNWQSYCLDSLWTLNTFDFWEILIISFSFHVILQQLDLFSSFSSSKGGNTWTRGEFGQFAESFSWRHLFKVPKLPKPRYPSDAYSNKETKKVWTLQPNPSPRSSLRSLGKVQ